MTPPRTTATHSLPSPPPKSPLTWATPSSRRVNNRQIFSTPSEEMETQEFENNKNEQIEEKDDDAATKPITISPSLLKHLQAVKASWPEEEGGVACTGEPSIDPSRQIEAAGVVENEEWWC
eukprot:4488241-Ditylum_brightwellii.AAC.1